MLTQANPKLPMRNKAVTREYYISQLGFKQFGSDAHEEYLMMQKDNVQLHFFLFTQLNLTENYGQVYLRTDDIDGFYQWLLNNNTAIHPNGKLILKPWGQKEFSVLDPDNNLLTFGQGV
ncbi:MAG: VOC family protein [Ferruginibacter sp.]|nr:VOC family protein [Ferruginibacter sp.]